MSAQKHRKRAWPASRSFRRSAGAAATVALTLSTLLVSSAGAAQHPPLGPFGSASQPAFSVATGIAVDQATGDVLVIDESAGTVSRFHADGTSAEFSALGSNVIDGTGPEDETKHGALEFPSSFAAQVAVDNSGGVADGDIYVTQVFSGVVDIFSQSGKHIGELTTGGGVGLGEACGVAVDGAGDVFVGSREPAAVNVYNPTANPPTDADNTSTFETVPRPCNISAGAGPTLGSLFVSTFRGPVTKIDAVTGEVDYEIQEGENNPATSIDPSTGHVFIASGSAVKEVDASGLLGPRVVNTLETVGEGEGVAVDGTTGHLYVSPSRKSGERFGAVRLVEYGPLSTFPPQILDQAVISVTGDEATAEAKINPEGLPTTARVEYGTTATYGSTTTPIDLGQAEFPTPVRITLKGLTAGASYHLRFVAQNAIGTNEGPDLTGRTSSSPGGSESCPNSAVRSGPSVRLADCRAYEMVTPVDKNGLGLSAQLNLASNPVELNQSALTGDQLTYSTVQSFGSNPQGASYASQYLAAREETGWRNESITPPQTINLSNPGNRLELEYQLFLPDLCTALLNHYADPILAPDAIVGVPNTYRWTNCGAPRYEAVSTVPSPLGIVEAPPIIFGLSADGRCGLVEVPEGGLYETCGAQTRLINVLPDGVTSERGAAGTAYPSAVQEYTLRLGNYQGAISADGSRVYWTPGFGTGPLYLRMNAQAAPSARGPQDECTEPTKACTVPISTEPESLFWGASPDGARAIYSVRIGSEQSLYEFNLSKGGSTLLAGEVAGVMGTDVEASRTYFVSKESLSGEAVAGEPNLYMYDATKSGVDRIRYIATVSSTDAESPIFGSGVRLGMVQVPPTYRPVRISPDGLHAVFSSYAPLTGYDNTDAVSGKADLEVFVYDAQADSGQGSLTCVSCNPSGQRPHGVNYEVQKNIFLTQDNPVAALIPPPTTSFFGSRAMSDDGTRVFFDSYDALLPADTNGKEDVYEWEAPGSGPAAARCTAANASFSPSNGGCLTLISSGESASDSEFVDAGQDGRDVFFKTASSLVPQDPGLIDIYDAREEGGFSSPPGQPVACEGEACQSPGPPPPASSISSTSLTGPGNAKPKKHRRPRKSKKKHERHHHKTRGKKKPRHPRAHKRRSGESKKAG